MNHTSYPHHTAHQRSHMEPLKPDNQNIVDSLLLAGLLRHLRVCQCGRVIIGQQADQVRRLLEGLEALVNFAEEVVGNVLAQHHLAGGGGFLGRGRHGDDRAVIAI
jgi:hypothetical protein